MKAGIGSAEIQLRDGIIVAAIVAVNAVGDIVDPATGKVIAGMRTEDGKGLADVRTLLRSRPALRQPQASSDLPAMNTTLGIVATNATLTKTQATRVAQIAHDGFARAIVPVHTASDGDMIFALATGSVAGTVDADLVGWAAAEAIAQAIVRAARAATSIPGYPAARDLHRERVTVTLFLLLLYSVLQIGLGLWIGRRVREVDGFLRRRPRPVGRPHLLDIPRGKYRRGLHRRCDGPWLCRRLERVVAQRLRGPRVAGARVLDRPADLARGRDSR